MPTRKQKIALLVKAPTKYTIVDEDDRVCGTANSLISAVDIAKQIGFSDCVEAELEQCLKHIFSSEDFSQSSVLKYILGLESSGGE